MDKLKDPTEPIKMCDHVYMRKLIRMYHNETDPIKKEELMQKMLALKAAINWQKTVIDCG